MKLSKRIKAVVYATLVMLALSAIIAFAAPGDSNDPLISLSYITETLIPEIDARVDQKVLQRVNEAMKNYTPSSGSSSSSFVLVNVKKNQKVVGSEGTEFVIRSGSATIAGTYNGGIADLTAGVDLANGAGAPLNHHLLVPRNDSRGIKFTTDGIVLIKGSYTMK